MDPLWARFLNSDWHDYRGTGAREDRLFKDDWLQTFLAGTCWGDGSLPDAAGRDALLELRGTMWAAVETIRVGQGLLLEHLGAFNRILGNAPVVRIMDEQGGAGAGAAGGRPPPAPRGAGRLLRRHGREGGARPPQDLREPRLRLGHLRREPEPVPPVVRSRRLRQPPQGPPPPAAQAGREAAYFRPCRALKAGHSRLRRRKASTSAHWRNGLQSRSQAIVEEGRAP